MYYLKKIKILDTFGVPIKLQYNRSSQFTSPLGAIFSVIVYVLSFIYAIYIFEEWINWKILPKVQTQINTIRYTQVQLEEGAITFGYFNDSTIDPFSRENNILTPILIKLNNTTIEFVGIYFSELRAVNYAPGLRPTVNLPGINLTLTKGLDFKEGQNNEISYMLIISMCDEKLFIGSNATCASQKQIEEFLETSKTQLDFNVNLNSYNIQTQQFEIIQKSLYFTIQTQNRLFSQIMMKTTKQTIDTGILFNNQQEQIFIDDFNVITEFFTQEVQKKFGTQNYLMQFFLKLDNIQTTQNIGYNKLGEILAQIGSIVQLLLIVKYGLFFFNQQQLDQQLMEDIIKFQHPELQALSVKKNIFGSVQTVKFHDLNLNICDYQNFLDQAQEKIKEKFNINNIIKEIIALQMFIQDTFNVCTSIQFQNMRYDEQFLRSKRQKIFPSIEEAELKSNGCISDEFKQKLQIESIS